MRAHIFFAQTVEKDMVFDKLKYFSRLFDLNTKLHQSADNVYISDWKIYYSKKLKLFII